MEWIQWMDIRTNKLENLSENITQITQTENNKNYLKWQRKWEILGSIEFPKKRMLENTDSVELKKQSMKELQN